MTRGNIYIAGPIKGIKNYKANFNKASKELERDGWLVVSPVTVEGDDLRAIMALELDWIARCADAVYMLRGWENSLGAQAEWALARALSLQIYYQE